MQMRILLIFCTLTWALSTATTYVPRVTKSLVECPRNDHDPDHDPDYFSADVARFGDSDTLMLVFGNRLYMSFDNGENWRTIDGIWGSDDCSIDIDPFHEERAFVSTISEGTQEIYVTEDQGKSWRRVSTPREVNGEQRCYIGTHPFDRNLLLLNCDISHELEDRYFSQEDIIYASNDGGESFRRIAGPSSDDYCQFAASSKKSTLSRNGIYCVRRRIERAEVQSSNQGSRNFGETSFQEEHQLVGTLFYTTDLGKTKKVFDELNGFSVEDIFVLPSCVAVVTSEGNYLRDKKVWISKGTSFHLAHLPEKAYMIGRIQSFPGDDQGRLLLEALVSVEDNKEHGLTMRSLVSGSSDLNFFFLDPTPETPKLAKSGIFFSSPVRPSSLKGTLWGRFSSCKNMEEDANFLQKALSLLKNLFRKKSRRTISRQPSSVTKGSFDNGKTWTNLKVIDPSGKHKHLFKCNIDDVEHCSFQEGERFISSGLTGGEQSGGIIMKIGIADENYCKTSYTEPNKDDMTFISRDGGVSWEVAFEFPVKATFLDLGNIIVAMHFEERQEYVEGYIYSYTKFFFSLDQGRTWNEYSFDKPIYASYVIPRVHDLKAHLGFSSYNNESIAYVFYTIDFSNAFNGNACTVNDWETWYLSNGNCIDGKRYSFDRRKPNAKCLMTKTFEKLELHEETCV